jgi:hypothetical protein
VNSMILKVVISVAFGLFIEGLTHGVNRRGGTIVHIRCCYRIGVRCCPLFNKSQKCGEGGKHKYRCWPLHSIILNYGASEDPGV